MQFFEETNALSANFIICKHIAKSKYLCVYKTIEGGKLQIADQAPLCKSKNQRPGTQ